jgi:heat-inducible transcriptional repressor
LRVHRLNARDREELAARYAIPTDDLDSALRETSRVLAALSSHTVVLIAPRPQVDQLEHVEFVRLRDQQLLCILVTRSGQVQNKIVTTTEPISVEELERVNSYLLGILQGLTLEGVTQRVRAELASERSRYDAIQHRALTLSAEALQGTEVPAPHVIIEGQSRLVERLDTAADPAELEKTKALFRALEEKRHLLHLLEGAAQAPGIRVFIGAESQIPELRDFTVVAATYGDQAAPGGEAAPLGTLGVIGPTRMNYSRVINLVDFTAQLVSGVVGRR